MLLSPGNFDDEMKEHVEAGFARIFADDVRGRQVEEGRAQLGADGVHLEQIMIGVNEAYESSINDVTRFFICFSQSCLMPYRKLCGSKVGRDPPFENCW